MADGISIHHGLRKLSRALKRVDAEAPKELTKINKEVAKIGANAAKAKAKSLGSTQAKSAPALRASGAGGAVSIILGSAARPYAIGAELGSKQGYRKKQFPLYKGFPPPGNAFAGSWGMFLGPSLRENKDNMEEQWKSGIDDLLDRIIPDSM